MERSIIHLNIADFAVAVETNLTPGLKGYPLVIAPLGAPRAVVYDMSDEAYNEGIRKGMPLARALRLNKKTKVLPPSFNRYELAMKDLLKQTLSFTPRVESGTDDGHIFMDLTGTGRLFGPTVDVAFRLKKNFKKAFCLDPIWSVATNKLVAKVATRIVKPIGEYIVAPGEETDFLSPLPIDLIPGLEPDEIEAMHEFNLVTVSQVRALTLEQLSVPFRHRAGLIHDRIRGIDHSPVTRISEDEIRIRADHQFSDDTNDADQLRKALYLMISQVCSMLRKKRLHGAGAQMILSYSDGLQSSSNRVIKPSTSNEIAMFRQCTRLLEKAWTRRIRVRHMRLICRKLAPPAVQAQLFTRQPDPSASNLLAGTMDKIKKKFGKNAILPALALAENTGSR